VRHVVDYDSSVPPYQQVAKIISDRIDSGEIPPGGAVPSVARIMQEFGVARTTAGKALNYLQDQGKVKIVRGWGTFAVDNGR
jgi:DNA-binding GntR family transcriptional regulator